MTFVDVSPLLACLLCSSLFEASSSSSSVAELRSGLFNVVQLAGTTQCSTDSPSATLEARSSAECSLRCAGGLDDGTSCSAFNFKQAGQSSCELFENVPLTNDWSVVSGCTLYQVYTDVDA